MKSKRGNIDKLSDFIIGQKMKKLEIAGAMIQAEAKSLVKVGKYPAGSGKVGGALRDSIFLRMTEDSAQVGSNLVYAAMQEFGGVVNPVRVTKLTIPIAPEAVGRRAEDFEGLFVYVKKETGQAFLARNEGGKLKVYFVLVDKAEIPAAPYLRPALETKRKDIKRILNEH
jgi:phage gpG-like protein